MMLLDSAGFSGDSRELQDSKQEKSLAILIPCFNEEKAIADTIGQILELDGQSINLMEIIVVDDGSTDGTPKVLRGYEGEVQVITNESNRGYGASLKRGVRASSCDLICIIDADGSYPVDRIPDLIKEVVSKNCDMAVAARVGDNVAIPLIRRPAKWVLGKLATYVAGMRIPDMNSGMRIFPRNMALQMMDLLPDGFSFTTTITLAMLTNGYSVQYMPINYYERIGRSKIRPIRDTLNFLHLISKIALYFAPLKVFLPLSAGLMLLAIFWALFSYLVLGQLADVSTLVLFMTSIQTVSVGLLAELVHIRIPSSHKIQKD